MLGKLIKHEFKAVTNIMLLINGCTLLLSLVGCLTFVSPLWELEHDYIPIMAACSVVVYYIAIIAISFGCLIYLTLRFYKNMYTDEGYLMHTLPVTPRQLILSKGITALFWLLITSIMICFSVVSILLSAFLKFMDRDELLDAFSQLPEHFMEAYGMGMVQWMFWMGIVCVISSISALLMIYASISLGQLFSKHKVIASVGCYILLIVLNQVVSMIIMLPSSTSLINMASYELSNGGMRSYFYYIWISTTALSLVSGVVYYFITEYVMTKKLNLE